MKVFSQHKKTTTFHEEKGQGYTLLELIVVVTILGLLLLATIPALRTMAAMSRLETAAQDLAAVFRYARGQAVFGERAVEVRIDAKGGRYRLDLMMTDAEKTRRFSRARKMRTNDERIRALPDNVAFQDIFVWQDQVNEKGNVVVEFFPNGTVTPIVIVLTDESKRLVTIELTRATGQPRTTEGKPETIALPEQSGISKQTYTVEE